MSEVLIEEIKNISEMGNILPAGYKYYKKKITPGLRLILPGVCFKWYNLYPVDKIIKNQQIVATREFIESEIKSGKLKFNNELGYIILHRAEEYLLLLLTTWRHKNEMWESVYFKKTDNKKNYKPIEFKTSHKGTYCVWELGIVWHERNAWVKFIKSKRDSESKLNYINDLISGEV